MASDRSFPTRFFRLLPPLRRLKGWMTTLSLANIKYILFTSALALLACFTILNQIFISNLQSQALQINDKEARLYAVAIAEQLNREEINVIFNEIVRKSQVPMIITDNQNVPINWNNISYKFWSKGKSKIPQVPFFYLAKAEQEFLLKLVKDMDKKNKPLELEAEGHIFGFLHYGEFTLVHILAWMPMVELVIIFLFCFVGYFGFHIIRSNEQSVLWVGLGQGDGPSVGNPHLLPAGLDRLPASEAGKRAGFGKAPAHPGRDGKRHLPPQPRGHALLPNRFHPGTQKAGPQRDHRLHGQLLLLPAAPPGQAHQYRTEAGGPARNPHQPGADRAGSSKT